MLAPDVMGVDEMATDPPAINGVGEADGQDGNESAQLASQQAADIHRFTEVTHHLREIMTTIAGLHRDRLATPPESVCATLRANHWCPW